MHGAILIYGGRKEQRHSKALELVELSGLNLGKENNPDLLNIQPEKGKSSIGIEKSREIRKFLSQRPYESIVKAILIEDAHLLTVQAQNTLLKTLEELPSYASVILECPDKNELLETIISRCQKIQITKEATETKDSISWEKIKRLPINSRLDLAEKVAKKDRPETISLLEDWIDCERALLKEAKKIKDLEQSKKNLEMLLDIRNDLKSTNVNLALAIDFLLISLGE